MIANVVKPGGGCETKSAHYTESSANFWRIEWGYEAVFSSCTSARAGACILFNNNFCFQVLKQHSDPHGRFIVIDISSNEKVITLVNLYAPNHDDPDLFQKVLDVLSDFTCDDITCGGDFNLILDIKRIRKGAFLKHIAR